MAVQMEIDLEPGLTDRFGSLSQVCAAAVYDSRRGQKWVAAEMDMTPSELSKRLNSGKAADDPRPLHADHVERIVEITGDLRPVLYLVERFFTDRDTRQREAVARIEKMLPELMQLVKSANAKR
ncbi:MAG: hypothetical protein AB7Q76_04105 [Gammaproteobacteria bacterium]